jgi:hypothetical protein
VAPRFGFLFTNGGFSVADVRATSGIVDTDDMVIVSQSFPGAVPMGPVSGALQAPGAAAQASVQGPGAALPGVTLQASGQALDPWATGVQGVQATFNASARTTLGSLWADFMLAPHSAVSFGALSSVSVAVDDGLPGDGWQQSTAYAQTFLSVYGLQPAYQVSTAGCVLGAAQATGTVPGPGGGCGTFAGGTRGVLDQWVEVTFVNDTDAPMPGYLIALVQASGSVAANPVPVPEPAAAWLALAGLAAGWGGVAAGLRCWLAWRGAGDGCSVAPAAQHLDQGIAETAMRHRPQGDSGHDRLSGAPAAGCRCAQASSFSSRSQAAASAASLSREPSCAAPSPASLWAGLERTRIHEM